MIVFISYHHDDKPLMLRWANHIKKLGGASKHHIIVMPAHGVSTEGVMEPLREAFGRAEELPCFHTEQGWPISCNRAFEQAAWHSYQVTKQSFLWMEPDAIPLKSSWLDDIEAEYKQCGKPFMGDFVRIAGVLPNGIDHMSGIAVYHWDMPRILPSVFNNDNTAWDIASGREVVMQVHRTGLIQHDWIPEKKWRRDVVTRDCVNPLAVVYHPDKLGVLMSDSAIPNDVQGDPAMGAVLVTQKPHETKDIAEDYKGEIVTKSFPVIDPWKEIIDYAKENPQNQKAIVSRLIQEGIITKASCAKFFGKKVRPSMGKRGRPKAGDRIKVPSSSPLEG